MNESRLVRLVPAVVATCAIAVAPASHAQTSSHVGARARVNGIEPPVEDVHELNGATASRIETAASVESYPLSYFGHVASGSAAARPGHVNVQDDLISHAGYGHAGLKGDGVNTTEQAIFTDTLQVLDATTLAPVHWGVLHGRAVLSGVFDAPTYSSIHGAATVGGAVGASVLTSGYPSSSFTTGATYCVNTGSSACDSHPSGFGAPMAIDFDAGSDSSGDATIEFYLVAFSGAGGYPGRDSPTLAHIRSRTASSSGLDYTRPVPEPAAAALLSLGLATTGIARRAVAARARRARRQTVNDSLGHGITPLGTSDHNHLVAPAVPEPGSAALLVAGLPGLAIAGRRKTASD